ncbi:MAG: A/G-specific adenine glycosylase [Holosporales bacterium]|jgi:A/G-specific adenine glycosylase|nr:A/G-specific adenine glycosylase [Holosporales bacterium]
MLHDSSLLFQYVLKGTITQALLNWYGHYARKLPWRAPYGKLQDPYIVWISESMLQQTMVATVEPYFARFMTAFPTLVDLARASLDDVLRLWQGLGYYSRARNIHYTAHILLKDHEGMFPNNAQHLQELPGIGPYTAAAIASMAFGEPVVAMDANVTRVIARLFALSDRKYCAQHAQNLCPAKYPGDFNQALMDLGAQYCRAHQVVCTLCPLEMFCLAYRENQPFMYPYPKEKAEKRTRYALFFCALSGGHLLLERRPEKGLLGGLYGLPTTPWTETLQNTTPIDTPIKTVQWLLLHEITHTFTHFRLHAHILYAQVPWREKGNEERFLWVPYTQLAHYGIPTVFKKALKHDLIAKISKIQKE